MIAYGTNLVVIVPKAFRTFHDQCPVHIRVLAIFTGTFRVKGGGRFRPGGGGGNPLQEPNGDPPLDVVPFSRLSDYNGVSFSIELLE